MIFSLTSLRLCLLNQYHLSVNVAVMSSPPLQFKEYLRITQVKIFLWYVNFPFSSYVCSQSNLNKFLSKGFSFSTFINCYTPDFCFPGWHLSLSCSCPHFEVYKYHRPRCSFIKCIWGVGQIMEVINSLLRQKMHLKFHGRGGKKQTLCLLTRLGNYNLLPKPVIMSFD